MNNKTKLIITTGVLLITACHKYNPGDCITTADGHIWKINQIRGTKYIATGFTEKGWGNDAELDFDILERKKYYKSTCPIIQ